MAKIGSDDLLDIIQMPTSGRVIEMAKVLGPRPRREWPQQGGPTFRYAPPFVEEKSFGRIAPNEPFLNAGEWQRSVYFFWWEYLRCHSGYQRTCKQGGAGRYRKLYGDFGDVFETDFLKWWEKNGVRLFAEPRTERARAIDRDQILQLENPEDYVFIVAPVDRKYHTLMRHIGQELKAALKPAKEGRAISRAKYRISGKPVLHALHMHLHVWKIRKEHTKLRLYEIAEKAGLKVDEDVNGADPKRALATLASRHIRIAEEYIKSAASTEFPRRKGKAITKGP